MEEKNAAPKNVAPKNVAPTNNISLKYKIIMIIHNKIIIV